VYSSQRWDQANHPQIVPLISNNKKGPDMVVWQLLTYLFLLFRHKPLRALLHTNCLVYTSIVPFLVHPH